MRSICFCALLWRFMLYTFFLSGKKCTNTPPLRPYLCIKKRLNMQRKNFAFRFEWMQAIASYSPDVRLEIYEATILYAETGELPEMSPQAARRFEVYILPDFERRRKAAEYRARAKARRQAKEAAAQTNKENRATKTVMSDSSNQSDTLNNSNQSPHLQNQRPRNKSRRFSVR